MGRGVGTGMARRLTRRSGVRLRPTAAMSLPLAALLTSGSLAAQALPAAVLWGADLQVFDDEMPVEPIEQAVYILKVIAFDRNFEERAGDWRPFTFPRSSWETARHLAGLDGVRLHDLRGTWASRLVRRGVPLPSVMALGGWKSLVVLQKYLSLHPEQLRGAIEALED